MNKTFIIAEIGINFNGDMDIAKRLIDLAKESGCDAVKFQKRTIEDVYTPEELDLYRESPFGTTNREQKNGLEFGKDEYDEIDRYCKEVGIEWFASPWDKKSVDFLMTYNPKYIKIASALASNKDFVSYITKSISTIKPDIKVFMSTGMCTLDEVRDAVTILEQNNIEFELMHCVSTYPMKDEDANLHTINTLKIEFGCMVGYSGHETGIQISVGAVAMGATSIERHITLDRTMYGSDQPASLEPEGLKLLVRDIRIIEKALGTGRKVILEKEKKIREKLSKPYWTVKN
jgi:N-acetylneuraminate synthase